MPRSSLSSAVLALALLASACAAPTTPRGTTGAAGGTRPKPTTTQAGDRPAVTPPGGTDPAAPVLAARLAGAVRVLSDNGGGIIAGNTAGIISNNTGGIVSNNAGGIVSNNAGGLISDNGGNLVGKAKRVLLADAGPGEFLLADAEVAVVDAAGRPVLGADGKPMVARTDGQGRFAFAASPPRNAVLQVKLWNGGIMKALLPLTGAASAGGAAGDAREAAIDTETTLGASYVLSRFVKGDQATLDKLPAAEADRLARELKAGRALVTQAPKYEEAELVALADTIKDRVPAVGAALEEIRALLLGQANLGAGRPATEVPLFDTRALALDAAGRLFVAEHTLGRVRAVAPDGTIATYADKGLGAVPWNWPALTGLAVGPDGALYVAAWSKGAVYRVGADKAVTAVAGQGPLLRGAVDVKATETTMIPQSLLFMKNGDMLVGEAAGVSVEDGPNTPPRVLRVGADGVVRKLPFGDGWGVGRITGMAEATDGALWVHYYAFAGEKGTLYRQAPGGGAIAAVATDLPVYNSAGLVAGADGEVYLAEAPAGRVEAFGPAGQRRTVVSAGVGRPTALLRKPDGTLLVADQLDNVVRALRPDGGLAVVAGKVGGASATGDAVSLNMPGGVAFDAQGKLLIAETGGNVIRRFDGATLTTVAGTTLGFGGDGGPAAAARLEAPIGLAYRDGTLTIADSTNWRIRRVGADGTITTLAGKRDDAPARALQPGAPVPAADFALRAITSLTVDAQNRPYVVSPALNQVWRVKDGMVELVLGAPGKLSTKIDLAAMLTPPTPAGPAAAMKLVCPSGVAFEPGTGALIVADTGNARLLRVTGLDGAAFQAETFAGTGVARLFATPVGDVLAETGLKAKDASFVMPGGLCYGPDGSLYVTELGTRNLGLMNALVASSFELPDGLPDCPARVRKIAPDGTVSTIAGPGGRFFADPAAEDALVLPAGIAIDPAGRLVIADAGANQVRILPAGSF